MYNFSGEYSKIYLCDLNIAYVVKDQYLGKLDFGIKLDFITDLTDEPIVHDHSPHVPLQQEGNYSRATITLDSNIGLEIDLV